MSNVVFELFAKLGLDSSEYEKGLGDAKGKASSIGGAIGNGLKTAAKIGGAAIATATAAVGAFATSSVKTGADFDKSMSQVAATMGLTMDEMANQTGKVDLAWGTFSGNLREYAQEMGRNTAFSATQAADALNYMALAGYDTQTSMEMLPNVLNLAAAGGMELADASDMVTDAQSALGLSLDETSDLVDKMAQASSKSNTSVSQLGEAILTIGGTAKNLAGGTTELSQALGLLADNGIKGAEGGTALRNILLNLTPKSKDAAAAMQEIGLNAYDAEGKMRPLKDIFTDLNNGLEGMTDEQKTDVLSTIFNKVDLKSVNALLATNVDRWDELGEAIDNSSSAAQNMAGTQLDNLAGDVTLFQSALEGAKIAISDQLTPSLMKFVQFGTDGLSRITDAFQKGGISGAMAEIGTVLSDGIAMITEMLPDAINAGMELLGAVGQGIIQNLPVIIDAATQIIPMLGQGIIQALPALLDGAIQIVSQLGAFLIESIPTMIPAIIQLVTQLGVMLAENAPALVNGVIALVTGIAVELINNLPLLLDATIQILIALAQAIIQNLPVFVDASMQILAAIGQLLAQYGIQFLKFVGQSLTQLVTSVGNGMRGMFNTVINWLAQLPGKMAYYAGYAIGEFIKFVIQLPSKVSSIFTSVISAVASFGTNFVNKAIEMASNFFKNIVNGLVELPSRMAVLGQQLVQAIADLPSRFMEIGSNIVEGIWNGIKGGWDWLTKQVKKLADDLVQGVKHVLKIKSPSRVFMGIGKMVDEGFAKGIIDNEDRVMSAMQDLISIPSMDDFGTQTGHAGISAVNAGSTTSGYTQIINITSPTALTPYEVARQTRNATRDMFLSMRV